MDVWDVNVVVLIPVGLNYSNYKKIDPSELATYEEDLDTRRIFRM